MDNQETLSYPHNMWPVLRQIDGDFIYIRVNSNTYRLYFPRHTRGGRSIPYDMEGHRFILHFKIYPRNFYRHILHFIDITMRYAFAFAIFLPQMPLVRIQEERTILWDIRRGSPPRLEQDTDLLSLRSN